MESNAYKKLTPTEKKACRKYILQTFKKHNVKIIKGKKKVKEKSKKKSKSEFS
jgi:hypothetical protein